MNIGESFQYIFSNFPQKMLVLHRSVLVVYQLSKIGRFIGMLHEKREFLSIFSVVQELNDVRMLQLGMDGSLLSTKFVDPLRQDSFGLHQRFLDHGLYLKLAISANYSL